MYDYIVSRTRTLAEWLAVSVLNAVSLAIWVLIQWSFQEFGKAYALSLVDIFIVSTFQIILAISTLAVPVFHIYIDVARMWYQSRKEVESIAKQGATE